MTDILWRKRRPTANKEVNSLLFSAYVHPFNVRALDREKEVRTVPDAFGQVGYQPDDSYNQIKRVQYAVSLTALEAILILD